MTRFARTLTRYRSENGGRLPFFDQEPPTDLDDLLGRMRQVNGKQFDAAVRFVIDLKDCRAVDTLLDLMWSAGPERAQTLSQAIASIGGRAACPGLERIVRESESFAVRRAAVYGLTWLFDDRAFPILLDLYRDPSEAPEIRAQAAEAIGYIVADARRNGRLWRTALAAFVEGLEDGNGDVRFWSVSGLGRMRAKSAVAKLRRVAAFDADVDLTTSGSIREEARDAVAFIEAEA